jgi:hypothetical protein
VSGAKPGIGIAAQLPHSALLHAGYGCSQAERATVRSGATHHDFMATLSPFSFIMLSSDPSSEFAMRCWIFRILAATWLAILVAPVSGAEVRRSSAEALLHLNFAEVLFEGKIKKGDYDKLLGLIGKDCEDRCPSSIFLASPGGDVIEAMKIGRLVRKLRFETYIPSDLPIWIHQQRKYRPEAKLKDAKMNYMCASACFFIFVAGIKRERDIFPPILGIHRPYLSEHDLRKRTGNQVMDSSRQVRVVIENYLKEMGVPAKYADLMFSTPKGQVRFISENDFESDFEGWIPELHDWLDAKCNNLTDIEKVVSKDLERKKARREMLSEDDRRMSKMLMDKNLLQGECQLQTMSKLREVAWKQFRDKL